MPGEKRKTRDDSLARQTDGSNKRCKKDNDEIQNRSSIRRGKKREMSCDSEEENEDRNEQYNKWQRMRTNNKNELLNITCELVRNICGLKKEKKRLSTLKKLGQIICLLEAIEKVSRLYFSKT